MKFSSLSVLTISLAASQSLAFSPSRHLNNRISTSLSMSNPTESVFLNAETAKKCIDIAGGTPLYAYSMDSLNENADRCLAFPNAFGLTVRYAMKACPNSTILKIFNKKGIHIDASSGYEVRRAMAAGIPAENISLSTQELPADFAELVDMGVKVNAWYVYFA
jgi:diaminopimelate decarboxylase